MMSNAAKALEEAFALISAVTQEQMDANPEIKDNGCDDFSLNGEHQKAVKLFEKLELYWKTGCRSKENLCEFICSD